MDVDDMGEALYRMTESEPAAPNPLVALVEKWFQELFPGSAVARDVTVWNHVHGAVEDLKKRLVVAPE